MSFRDQNATFFSVFGESIRQTKNRFTSERVGDNSSINLLIPVDNLRTWNELASKACPFATTIRRKNVMSGSTTMSSILYWQFLISCIFEGMKIKGAILICDRRGMKPKAVSVLLLADHCCKHARNGHYKITSSFWVFYTKHGNFELLKRLDKLFSRKYFGSHAYWSYIRK
jgi:hypothetical protein